LIRGEKLKKLPIIGLLLLVIGCVPVVSTPPIAPPVAYIDSTLPQQIIQGDKVVLVGHGTSFGGSVVAHEWRSSEDGVLSKLDKYETSSLSIAKHTIYYRVQDSKGNWSKEVYFFINVIPRGASKPVINIFDAKPDSITEGDSLSLMWNVSGASTVSIKPGFGDLPVTGSRAITPKTSTIYILTANNEVGTISAEVKVNVMSVPIHNIELFSIPEEGGHVRRDGITGVEPNAGCLTVSAFMQAFMSFDISMIPAGAIVQSASIDITNLIQYGQPFGVLGGMGIFHDQYKTLTSRNFVVSFPSGAMINTYSTPIAPYESFIIAREVQKEIDAGTARFQIRIQFEKYSYNSREANYLAFIPGKARLLITYKN
jgi:hypothetical protein